MGPGSAIGQPCSPFLLEMPEPLVGHAHADASGMCRFFHTQALNEDAIHPQGSTARAQTGMFMQVHPGLLGLGWLRNPHLPGMPRMNNLLRDHS